ncbi:MAG: kinase/pyrophosphorylase [Alphaproteobacteria bacterium]|jgi:regulator of PEP synthase PpsR (kinase-PPPase family)|nr:kinase/pyrophosphorylase [Alphaproteobacteria bacterium]
MDTRPATYFHLHLVSDSTGETLYAMSRAVCARFTQVLEIEHIYSLVRSPSQIEAVLEEIRDAPGVVLHTIVDDELRSLLEAGCQKLDMPCFGALDPLVSALSWYLGAPLSRRVGAQYTLDSDYFNRMDALSYALAHDDGQGLEDLQAADVILVGVSRTSKTPTCIYLAHRGVKAANVPLVSVDEAPAVLGRVRDVPVVGLTVSPDRLVQIRRNRLRSLNETRESDYVDFEVVRSEVLAARRLFQRQGWPVIDVTRRSVEETAAAVINMLSGGRGHVEVMG